VRGKELRVVSSSQGKKVSHVFCSESLKGDGLAAFRVSKFRFPLQDYVVWTRGIAQWYSLLGTHKALGSVLSTEKKIIWQNPS
jgi:hypothetical protein